jgi:hypothetical protein
MGKVYEEIDEKLAAWIRRQHLFFVATAPLADDGHVNVSPKGDLRWFRVLGPRSVGYLDFVGSGAETIAHARENGRIVVMFCAFDGPPNIVRLHGRGRVVLSGDGEFSALRRLFPKQRELGQRSVVVVDVERISDSCGFAVPLMDLRADRDLLDRHADSRDADYFDTYWRTRNATSIDGLEALPAPAQKASALPET